MIKLNSIITILLFAFLSCNVEQVETNKEVANSQTRNNKYNSNETYYYGDLLLVTETNLPLTGFVLTFADKEGYLVSESYYINGRLNGSYKHYYKDGSLSGEQKFVDGQLEGHSRFWFENGRKRSEEYYNHGELDEVSKRWFENGQIQCIFHYEDGLIIGWQREYLEDGAILYEVNLSNGNGEIAYMDAKTNIQIKEKFIGGKKVNPIRGKEFSDRIRSRRRNIIIENSFENGEINGMRKVINKDRPNQISSEINKKNGLDHGSDKSWYKNGNLINQGEYFFDQPDGLWQYWHENGQLNMEIKYDRGILISKKCWDESGKKIECECYNNKGDKIKCP
jgi:antitoxin component YwqK of YwqJK toxin-antitoxin module